MRGKGAADSTIGFPNSRGRGITAGRSWGSRRNNAAGRRSRRASGHQRFTLDYTPDGLEACGYLSFRSARLATAMTAATIQKRSVIFVSGMPLNWKWWWSGAMRKIRRPVDLTLRI